MQACKEELARIATKVDPYVETRPGFAFAMDSIAWSSSHGPVISRHGNVYTYVLRWIACGYFRAVHVWQKDDITEELRDVIAEIRTDPRFKCSEYVLMTEQSDVNQEFQSMLKDVGKIYTENLWLYITSEVKFFVIAAGTLNPKPPNSTNVRLGHDCFNRISPSRGITFNPM